MNVSNYRTRSTSLDPVQSEVLFGVGVGYDFWRVRQHLQAVKVYWHETLAQAVIGGEEIRVEAASHHAAQLLGKVWFHSVRQLFRRAREVCSTVNTRVTL